MSKTIHVDAQFLKSKARAFSGIFTRYSIIVFCLIVALLYGFILMRINALSTAPPSATDATAAEQKTLVAQPNIERGVIDKLMTLRDNSVSVQTLLNNARENPFQEQR